MVRSSSSEPSRAPKRKGTRSVSSLTPAQLTRKRANDREAQRAIRARTKEHIERLEAEVEELRKERSQTADQRFQGLLRKNQLLENEIQRLRESLGYVPREPASSLGPTSYSSAPYEETLSAGSGITSPRVSPFSGNDYSPLPAQDSYHGSNASSNFAVSGVSHSQPVSHPQAHSHAHPHQQHSHAHPHSHHGQHVPPSSVSSPCASSPNTDSEYVIAGGPPYIPTSMPGSLQQHHPAPPPHNMLPPGPMGDEMQPKVMVTPATGSHNMGYAHQHPHSQGQGRYPNGQWAVYPAFYPQQQQHLAISR